ncbi:zinc-finger domain-containing protein [Candidatus Thioglobus sp.]|uniref:zinc-finger domain-containing protein n=1 Tax=Candidatus Thioglobus sp. TaxID=2026721 RepID=UPI003D0AD99E
MNTIDDFQKKNVIYSIVKTKDLPFHCPPKQAQKWNMHPKVFIQFDNKGQGACPYCGSKYELS